MVGVFFVSGVSFVTVANLIYIHNKLVFKYQLSNILLANGNTGLFLSEKHSDLNSYISNDGGHTWKEIKKHPHLFEIADRGGLIVIAK